MEYVMMHCCKRSFTHLIGQTGRQVCWLGGAGLTDARWLPLVADGLAVMDVVR